MVPLPSICRHCGEDENPHRYQVVDIAPLEVPVTEHQLHELECDCCGGRTRDPLPADVPSNMAIAEGLVGLLSSAEHRQNHSMVSSLLWVLFAIERHRDG